MLIREVTSAEDQLNLLKRIIDSTWSAISAEAAREKAAKQQRATAAAAKPKPRKRPRIQPKRGGAAKAITPKSTTPPQPQHAAAQQSPQQPTQPNQAAATNATQVPQPRRAYPSPKSTPTEVPTEVMPIARLGKVAAVPETV